MVVKEMKRRDQSFKETERCKKEVIHEAKVLNSLGDHEGLPFLLGTCLEKEPYSGCSVSCLRGGEPYPPQGRQVKSAEQDHDI